MREICFNYSNSKGNSLIDDVGSFFEKMNILKNYEKREGQVQLAYDISKSIMNKKCMLAYYINVKYFKKSAF